MKDIAKFVVCCSRDWPFKGYWRSNKGITVFNIFISGSLPTLSDIIRSEIYFAGMHKLSHKT